MTVPVAIFTADHRHDVLRVMLYLYKKYWGWPAVIYGFKKPNFPLTNGVEFVSLGDMRDYPVDKWSNAVIKALDMIGGERFVMLLEDYWLTRFVDISAVEWLDDYMKNHPDIARADLTTDRLYAPNLVEVEPWGRLDIIENDPPADYHFSTQAGIWNKEALRSFLVSNEKPWTCELEGTNRMKDALRIGKPARVIGTRQCPVRYLIAVQNGKLALDGGYQVPAPILSRTDRQVAMEMMRAQPSNVDIAFAGVAKWG